MFAALSLGLCQPAFLSAARIDGLAKRPPGMAALRARRERNSRAFIVDKGTPNLCAASLVASPSRSQSSIAVRKGLGSFNNASSGNSRRHFRLRNRIRDELMAIRWSQVENLARPWN